MNLNISLNPQAKFDNLVVQDVSKELLIYNLENNKIYNLNETATLIWQNCDGTKNISQIAKELEKKLNQHVPDEMVWLALESLKKENLVNFNKDSTNAFKTLNRREVIKRVGLATMVALPLITSVIAPTAANAQSTTAVCNSCINRGDPCNGCETQIGFCYDNNACGCGQQRIAGVTCAQCKAGVVFAGGVGTGSFRTTNSCP